MTDGEVVEDYLSGSSMRCIAAKYNTNHKLISRILKRNGVETRPSQHRREQRKFDCKKKLLYNNMQTHLRFDVSLSWLLQFDDIEKAFSPFCTKVQSIVPAESFDELN